MAIRHRRGLESDFDKSKMLQAELAITTDTKKAFITFAPNDTKQLLTSEDSNNIIALSETMAEQIESFEQLVIDKVGINDSTATLTQAYSGSKTQGLVNSLNSSIITKANQSSLDTTNSNVALKASQIDLNTEVSNRINAVANEKSERMAEISVERSRIDSFTSLASGSTTGDAELIDGRSDNGFAFTNIGGNIRNKVSKNLYLLKDNVLTSGANSRTVAIDGTNGMTKYILIKNGNASSGYFGIQGFNSAGSLVFSTLSDQLIAPGGSYVFQILSTITASNVTINNISNRTNCTVDIYSDLDTATKDVVKEVLYTQNPTAITFADAYKTPTNATINTTDNRSIKFTTTAANGLITIAPPKAIAENDYIFHRMKVKSSTNCFLGVILYAVNEGQSSFGHHLIANKEYELYFRTKKYSAAEVGALKIIYQCDTNGTVVEITNMVAVKNSLDAWFDKSDKATMKNFNSRFQVVDVNGSGNFYNFPEALDFLKKTYDVSTIPTALLIKNGYYLQYPTNIYPYAPINKGANMISIFGESRDGVVIECYNTSTTQSKVLDIGGNCTIENLTIRSLNDGTYNLGNDLIHNPYCIHNDTGMGAQSQQYMTVVKNCKLYSACHSPVGAGLHDKQIQRYENCEFISNGINSAGALYVHASVESYAVDMGVEIINCSCVSWDGTKAITLPDTYGYGALTYVDIPVTIQRTIGFTVGSDITDANFKETHQFMPYNALNNVADWNA